MPDSSTLADRHVDANGLRLHYLEAGATDAPALVCLHGFTEQAHVFDRLAEAAASRYHVLALDFRGHGGSAWAADGYGYDRYLADFSAFIDAMDTGMLTIVGQSLGGIVAMLYAAAHPDRLERLALVDIGPETGPGAEAQRTSRPPRPMTFGGFDEAVAWSREGVWFSGPESAIRADLANKLEQRDGGTWVWRLDPALFDRSVPAPDQTAQLWAAYEAIACPVLEVRGRDSHFVSDAILDRMRAANPRLESLDVPKAAHIVPVDNADAFVEALAPFLGLG